MLAGEAQPVSQTESWDLGNLSLGQSHRWGGGALLGQLISGPPGIDWDDPRV